MFSLLTYSLFALWAFPFVCCSIPFGFHEHQETAVDGCFEMQREQTYHALEPLESPIAIPESIISAARDGIAERVGGEYADAYFHFAPEYSSLLLPEEGCLENPGLCDPANSQEQYRILFFFQIPGKPFIDQPILIVLDADGGLVTELDQLNVPQCILNPDECEFPVDQAQAIAIAKNAGLEEGKAEWVTHFLWNYKYKSYVWSVRNLLEQTSNGESGEHVLIDANSGNVLMNGRWECMVDFVGY